MLHFANMYSRHTLPVAIVSIVALGFFLFPQVSFATPGASCTGLDDCAPSGEACHRNVCRTSCTANSSACTTGTTCQPFSSGVSSKVCLPADSAATFTCNPACPSYQTCTWIESLHAGRCVNNQNSDGTYQTSTNNQGSTNTSGTASGQTLVNPLKAGSIPELLAAVLGGAVQIGSIFLVLALVWVGFLFVTAQGAEEKIKSARAALMWTVVGGLILLGAQGIALVIQATVGAL